MYPVHSMVKKQQKNLLKNNNNNNKENKNYTYNSIATLPAQTFAVN